MIHFADRCCCFLSHSPLLLALACSLSRALSNSFPLAHTQAHTRDAERIWRYICIYVCFFLFLLMLFSLFFRFPYPDFYAKKLLAQSSHARNKRKLSATTTTINCNSYYKHTWARTTYIHIRLCVCFVLLDIVVVF